MKEEYKVNNIFKEDGIIFNELVSTFLLAFLDKEFNNLDKNTNITSNL